VKYSLVLMLARCMAQNFRFTYQAKNRCCRVFAVLGVSWVLAYRLRSVGTASRIADFGNLLRRRTQWRSTV